MGIFDSDVKKGVAARLDKATIELNELEATLKFIQAEVEPRVLADFREAVDHVRLTAWAVQSWLEEGERGHSPYPLLPLLTNERIRRATRLCNQLARDVQIMELSVHGQGAEKFEELFRAVDSLHRPLAKLYRRQ